MKELTGEIQSFILKRFPSNCHWLDGNCYYFAVILKARFPDGGIYYDVIDGHFVFKYKEKFYDWQGETICVSPILWDSFEDYDSLQKERIIRDCIE